jgi:signal transduction histidine kinase
VAVTLAAEGRAVTLTVSDDGRGFDPGARADRRQQPGLGLVGMAERLDLLGGSLDIRSAPGQGTRVVVRVPVGEAP